MNFNYTFLFLFGLKSTLTASVGLGGNCKFPDDPNIVAVTPELGNGGWAMSPDQTCRPGTWCPYACKPGMVMSQWDPSVKCADGAKCATMNGGLFCNGQGKLESPFPNKPLCSSGAGTVIVKNQLSGSVSFCQTVYPGNEAMLISTVVASGGQSSISVPTSSYWLKTTAHYYVNLPGSTQEQCIWGKDSAPVGNWAPFVVGAGQNEQGLTYASATMNPLFLERGFQTETYNIRLNCVGPTCDAPDCTVTAGSGSICIVSAGAGSVVYVTLS